MAISDVISVLLNWPLYATEGMLKPGGSLITNQAIATFFCKLGIYSRAVLYVVSIESLVLISLDRFIAIVSTEGHKDHYQGSENSSSFELDFSCVMCHTLLLSF